MRNSGGETRKPHDFNTIGKSLDASHGIVQCNGVAVAFTLTAAWLRTIDMSL